MPKKKQSFGNKPISDFFPKKSKNNEEKQPLKIDENQPEINENVQQVEIVDTPVVELIEHDVDLVEDNNGKNNEIEHIEIIDEPINLIENSENTGKNNENSDSENNESNLIESDEQNDILNLTQNLDHPFRPGKNFNFPKKLYGKDKRSAHDDWWDIYPWLHWDSLKEKLFCFQCMKATIEKKSISKQGKSAFTTEGFDNWKKAMQKFREHAESDFHKDSFYVMERLPKSVPNVSNLMFKNLASEQAENRKCLLKIVENVRYHAQTNIAFQGDDLEKSNFFQTAKLRALDDPKFENWIDKKRGKFLHHESQNEILKIMALAVLRQLVKMIQSADFWTLMSDETTDITAKEQAVILIRYVTDNFEIYEEFVGLYQIEKTTAESIFQMLTIILTLVPCSKNSIYWNFMTSSNL